LGISLNISLHYNLLDYMAKKVRDMPDRQRKAVMAKLKKGYSPKIKRTDNGSLFWRDPAGKWHYFGQLSKAEVKALEKLKIGNPNQKREWFQEAIYAKPPYTLKGWSKNQPAKTRRMLALKSRPKRWDIKKRYLSAARALQALANVSTDPETIKKARSDAKYFFDKAKRR